MAAKIPTLANVERSDDSFDHRCDSLGCIQGCELESNEIKFVPKEFLSKSDDATAQDDEAMVFQLLETFKTLGDPYGIQVAAIMKILFRAMRF